jgi:uncharacterized membrane protein
MVDIKGLETRTRGIVLPATLQEVAFDAPWWWLASGWRDFWAAPVVSLCYGGAFAVIAGILTLGLFRYGLEALILPLSGGFLLLGPFAAIGLYETSRRLENDEPISVWHIARACVVKAPRIGFFASILGFIYLVWLQLAFLLLMFFLGRSPFPPAKEFIPTLIFTANGLGLLIAGACAGGVLALLVFSISAVSVPLLMARNVDAVTAAATSVAAVIVNPKPMLLWAGIVAGFMALGLATLFIGLIVIFPLIGYATWHAYRDVVLPEPSGYL